MRNFLLLCMHYIPLLMLFNIELLRKGNIFRGGGGGEGKLVFRGNMVFGFRGNPRASPLNETLDVWTSLFFFVVG